MATGEIRLPGGAGSGGRDHTFSDGMLIQLEISRSLQIFRSEAQQGELC